MVLKRFLNRGPNVSKMISDNGRTLVRAEKELNFIFSHTKSREVQTHLADSKITWEFITLNAPWFGGFYERMVGGCSQKTTPENFGHKYSVVHSVINGSHRHRVNGQHQTISDSNLV